MDLYFMADLALQGFLPGIFLDTPALWLVFWMMIVVVIDGIVDAYKKKSSLLILPLKQKGGPSRPPKCFLCYYAITLP